MSRSKNSKKNDLYLPLLVGGRRREILVPGPKLGWEWKEQGTQMLVLPQAQAQWKQSSALWRSVLLRRRSEVLSTGLPKFWDPEDSPKNVELLENEALEGYQPSATIKYDGQLMIRSVHAETVHWRSRTHFTVDDSLRETLDSLIIQYPCLADPSFHPQLSLQFELCSSQNRIVIEHVSSRLIFIGASENQSLMPLPWSQIEDIAEEGKLFLAETRNLSGSTLKEWEDELATMENIGEGLVLRDSDGFPCLRLKTPTYKRAFRLRYDYPPGATYRSYKRESERAKNTDDQAIIQAVLRSLDVHENDQLIVEERLDAFRLLEETCQARIRTLQKSVTESKEKMTRGVFAREIAAGQPHGPVMLKLWDEDEKGAYQMMLAHDLNCLLEEMDKMTVITVI